MPRTATLAQTNSSRANGAKSHGPKTEAGKKISSRNSLKHGLAAEQTIIPGEDVERFNQLLNDTISRRPNAGELELSILRGLAQDLWCLQRIRHLSREAHLLRITLQQAEVDETWANPTDDLRATLAMALELGPKGDIKNFAIYESRIHRHLKQTLQELKTIDEQLSQQAAPAKNAVKTAAKTNEPEAASTPVKAMACGSSRIFVAAPSPNPVANHHANVSAGSVKEH